MNHDTYHARHQALENGHLTVSFIWMLVTFAVEVRMGLNWWADMPMSLDAFRTMLETWFWITCWTMGLLALIGVANWVNFKVYLHYPTRQMRRALRAVRSSF